MRRFLREQSLPCSSGRSSSRLAGQAIAGHNAFNEEQLAHGERGGVAWPYVTSSAFGQAVMENWQSEYLQFALFMLATVWLLQRGSPSRRSSTRPGARATGSRKSAGMRSPDAPLWARAGGVRTAIYSNSLLIVMAVIFCGSWFAQSVTGWSEHNADQSAPRPAARVELARAMSRGPEFWEATFQNWQSEFLAVGSFAVFVVLPAPARLARNRSPSARHTDRPE